MANPPLVPTGILGFRNEHYMRRKCVSYLFRGYQLLFWSVRMFSPEMQYRKQLAMKFMDLFNKELVLKWNICNAVTILKEYSESTNHKLTVRVTFIPWFPHASVSVHCRKDHGVEAASFSCERSQVWAIRIRLVGDLQCWPEFSPWCCQINVSCKKEIILLEVKLLFFTPSTLKLYILFSVKFFKANFFWKKMTWFFKHSRKYFIIFMHLTTAWWALLHFSWTVTLNK